MKFNIWQYDEKRTGATGPWFFVMLIQANSEEHALDLAKIHRGKNSILKAYEAL